MKTLTMKRKFIPVAIFLALLCFSETSYAYWLWSPDVGKWINPKKAAKDTPEKQFEWAMEFYNKKDWDRAVEEFEKIPAAFPNSRLAAEAVYYLGLTWEERQDLAKAADAYQRLIDKYPYSDRIKDAIKREFEIANQFASGAKMKVLGIPALSGQEKSLELYKHIVKNAPFGTYGDQAQFQMGEVYKQQGEYEEAQKAFQAVVDEYPTSDLVAKARYQIAYSSMQASKKSQYNDVYAERAIEEFQGFKKSFPGDEQALEAEEAIKALRNKKAMTAFEQGAFYDKQNKPTSAKVYYQEVVSKYPDTTVAAEAKRRLENILKKDMGVKPKGKKFLLW
jgi:outer membrane assembly lipoprotein YfiO